MAGIFKSLDQSDIRVTPFRAHKQWAEDVNFTLYYAPTASLGYSTLSQLQTNFSQSINSGNNYYYFVGYTGNLFMVDGNDNFALLASTTNSPLLDSYASSAGVNQNRIAYFDYADNSINLVSATDLSSVDTNTFTIPYTVYNNTSWIPNSGTKRWVLMSGNDDSGGTGATGLTAAMLSASSPQPYDKFISYTSISLPNTNYLGTTFAAHESTGRDYVWAVYTDIGNVSTVYVEQQLCSGSGTWSSVNTSSAVSADYVTATRDLVTSDCRYINNPSAFFTFKGGTGVGLYFAYTSGSNLLCEKVDYEVVRLLQDKDAYRNGNYTSPIRTFAVLKSGYVLLDLYANETEGYGYRDIIDVRNWVGGGSIVAATINKNVDLISPDTPLTITVYAAIGVGVRKGPLTVFSINLETQEVSEPIHLGYHIASGGGAFFGDGGFNSTINFIGDNSDNKVVGLQYESYTDIQTGNPQNKIYVFNT